ncbi:MAG: hypothetical protein AAF092_05195 [Pseudomonadota bacterium]
MAEIALAPPSPRDREVQAAVLDLVEAYAFREAKQVLALRLKEIGETRVTHMQQLFLDWRDLPAEDRPDFLTYAHKRRNPELEAPHG